MLGKHFFSGTPETSFKVTGSIAKFLKNPAERSGFLKQLKKIYDARSKIVHGVSDSKFTSDEIEEFRSEAVKIGLDCLKKLIINKELLRMSSNDRCKEILILSDDLDKPPMLLS